MNIKYIAFIAKQNKSEWYMKQVKSWNIHLKYNIYVKYYSWTGNPEDTYPVGNVTPEMNNEYLAHCIYCEKTKGNETRNMWKYEIHI